MVIILSFGLLTTTLCNKMRVIYVSLVYLAVVAHAAKPKDKRTTVDPNPHYQQYNQAEYTHAASPYTQAAAREQQPEYLTAQTQHQYYQPEAAPQAQSLTYQPVAKYSTPSAANPQKYTYTPQPKQQIQYSSAADVSSFSYSSPIVSYNNLGLLKQLAGQSASSQDIPVTYSSSQHSQPSKVEYQPQQHHAQTQPKVQYISAPKYTSAPVQYTVSPKQSYTSAAKSQPAQHYSSAPVSVNAYSAANAAPNYEEIYQQLAQKASYVAPEAQQQQQQVAYQQSSPQKVTYQQSPRVVYQFPKAAGQEEASPSQQYTYQLPQEYESQGQSQSPQQFYYSQQASASQPQASPQYYTLSSQSQGKGGVQYA